MELTVEHLDVIQEMINIGVGNAANLLNSLSGKHVKLSVPEVKIIKLGQLLDFFSSYYILQNLSSVTLTFSGPLSGSTKLIFSTEAATKLVVAFTNEDQDELDFDEIQAETLSEIGNIVLNSLIGSISNLLNINLNYSIPLYTTGTIDQILSSNTVLRENGILLFAKTHFSIETLEIEGDFILFIDMSSVPEFINSLNHFIEVGGFFTK